MSSSDYSVCLFGIVRGARSMIRIALSLPRRPEFETKAEDHLAQARKVLAEALENVVKAQAVYQSKKVDA